MQTNEEKRNLRRKQSAECFTPPKLTNEIIDKLIHYAPETFTDPTKTFLDPSVGNGNLLLEVLKRKLKYGHNPAQALKTLYGVDIFSDNIKEARLRLLKVIINHVKEHKMPKPDSIELIRILGQNIVCTPLEKYPNGSLDYDFEFKQVPSDLQCKKGLDRILKEKLLDQVNIS